MKTEGFDSELYEAIPLARAMGVTYAVRTGSEVVLAAPLTPNSNHKGTAFGGSLHSVAVLAGWSLVTQLLAEAKIKIGYLVIQDSQMEYKIPVTTDFFARAAWVDEKPRDRFLDALRRKGLGRIEVQVEIISGKEVCGLLKARFAAQMASQ